MRVRDPGHLYDLAHLDGGVGETSLLRFVKRAGPDYPGNEGAYSGATSQEVLRALIDRARYVSHQEPGQENDLILFWLQEVLWQLEVRAARKRGYAIPQELRQTIDTEPTCPGCGHVFCQLTH